MSVKRILHLNLDSIYFDQIKSGQKKYEYRLQTDYWKKRLFAKDGSVKTFDSILIKRGYPQKEDVMRIIERPWKGFESINLIHEKFGSNPVNVFAVLVN